MVGGMGTRLMPLTKYHPKPILPILDKPCLKYLVESIAGSGIDHIIMACGYKSSQLMEAIGNGSDLGITIDYAFEDKPAGTAGAMKAVESRLDTVFVAANGDVFADISLEEQIGMHTSSNAEVTIALTSVNNPCEFGIVRVKEDGEITEFKEKPKPEEVFSDLINAGIYVVNKSALSYVPEGKFFDFSKELVPILMREEKKIQGYKLKGLWRDVGRPVDLLGANLSMASKVGDQMAWGGSRVEGTAIRKPFYLGKGATVTGSEVSAAVVMENTAVVNSKLINSVIMKDCKVNSAKIENSIIGAGCKIGNGAEITSSVIGDGLTIEAGKKIVEDRMG
jgi:mannose-1-phosphate guanylyltransferase